LKLLKGKRTKLVNTTKATTDFFSKNFPANGLVKIGTETKSNNLTIKTTSTRSFVADKKTKEVSEVYDTTIEDKYEFKDYSAALELKFQTSNVLQATLSKSDIVKGLKLSIGGLQDLSKEKTVQQTIQVGTEFKHGQIFFKTTAGIPLESGRAIPINGNVVVSPIEHIFLGSKFDLQYNTGDKGKIEKQVEFKASGVSGATRGHVTATLDKKLALFVNHVLDKDVIGAKIAAELPKEGTDSTKLSVDLAASHKYDSSTLLNAKLNFTPAIGDEKGKTGIRFGLGTTYTLRENCTATTAVDLNIGSYLGNGGAPHSLGFELKLK